MLINFVGLPTVFHIFAHTIPMEERSRAFGYLVAFGSIGQTVAAMVRITVTFTQHNFLNTFVFTVALMLLYGFDNIVVC